MLQEITDSTEEEVVLFFPADRAYLSRIEQVLVPFYCCHCDRQLPEYYQAWQGERETFAGMHTCPFCTAALRGFFPGYVLDKFVVDTYSQQQPIARRYRLNPNRS